MKRQKSCLILFLFYGGYILDNQLVMTTLTLTSVFTLLHIYAMRKVPTLLRGDRDLLLLVGLLPLRE